MMLFYTVGAAGDGFCLCVLPSTSHDLENADVCPMMLSKRSSSLGMCNKEL